MLLETGSVLTQISIAAIFLHQLEAIVCVILQVHVSCNTFSFENLGITTQAFPSFSWGIFSRA